MEFYFYVNFEIQLSSLIGFWLLPDPQSGKAINGKSNMWSNNFFELIRQFNI